MTTRTPRHAIRKGWISGICLLSLALLILASAGCEQKTPTDIAFVEKAPVTQSFPLGNTGATIEMVWIAPGGFVMGDANGESNERPLHGVNIEDGFWLGQFEVTLDQWQAITGNNPNYFFWNKEHPVESVSWHEIMEDFLIPLNDQEPGDPWRLPTEAEWEYACRAGTFRPFSFESDMLRYYANAQFSRDSTLPVGRLLPNPFGLYDMHGNVAEWTADMYHDNYSGAPTTSRAWNDANGFARVIRGGSWQDAADECRSTFRRYGTPTTGDARTGFRLVRGQQYTNGPPAEPQAISPPNETRNVPLETSLVWSCMDYEGDPITYDLYFGRDANPTAIATELTDTVYTLNRLSPAETYYWRVIARDIHDETTISPIWSFTTFEPIEQTFELAGTGVMVRMVLVQPDSFAMGSPDTDSDAEDDERPQHVVTLQNAFWTGVYEVTQEQWEAVTGENPSHNSGFPARPVEQVSWSEVQSEFIAVLNAAESGSPWRLPTEAEWEFLCRSGTSTRFSWGDDASFVSLPDFAWYQSNSDGRTHDVGSKLPNFWGIYDIHGNVAEWCQDWYHTSYFGAPLDGSAWESPVGIHRVFRGGAWNNTGPESRAASRFGDDPNTRSAQIGFRLVRDVN